MKTFQPAIVGPVPRAAASVRSWGLHYGPPDLTIDQEVPPMVTVELRAVRSGQWVAVASLTAHGEQHQLHDPEQLVDLALPVPHRGRSLYFADDPELWARLLPRLYHAPELYAVLVDQIEDRGHAQHEGDGRRQLDAGRSSRPATEDRPRRPHIASALPPAEARAQ